MPRPRRRRSALRGGASTGPETPRPPTSERFHPIIYVRGYAMTRGEIDQTTADPFCGFNLGSTVYRATPDKTKPAQKFVFESPVVRLASDFGYADVFENGLDIVDPGWTKAIPRKSIVIYRYYEQASTVLGKGKTPDIEEFASGLSDLILRVRDLVCCDPANGVTAATFRCHLVAHSMGGLVCRAFLQNHELGADEARACVEKVFTYATPHNGIEMAGLNVPEWLSANELSNFNRDRMAEYLDLKSIYKKTGRVDWLPEDTFPSRRFFCMVGTNRGDYEVAHGLSRAFAGHGSDGLVRIENASVWGTDKQGKTSAPCATAYAYRSHSGFYGIVNSEEAYQNLIRFLFGDIRIDVWVELDSIRLPAEVQKAVEAGKEVDALYQFEFLASPRGKRWYLTRRVAEEDSVACLRHKDFAGVPGVRRAYLSTLFLAERWRVDPAGQSLGGSVTLGIKVPDYEIDRAFWFDKHYEGGYLFRDSVVIELIGPQRAGEAWSVMYGWQSHTPGAANIPLDLEAPLGTEIEARIPFGSDGTPGIAGSLRFIASAWNSQGE